MVQRLKINQFYGAPTSIRLLLNYGEEWVKKYDRSSLKTLGSGKGHEIFFWKRHGGLADEVKVPKEPVWPNAKWLKIDVKQASCPAFQIFS